MSQSPGFELPSTVRSHQTARAAPVAAVIVLLLAWLWSYAPTLQSLIHVWRTDDNYSVGQLVPLAALYLLWIERSRLRGLTIVPCWWGGLVIVLGEGIRQLGLQAVSLSVEGYGMVVGLVGVVLLVGGAEFFRRVRWICLFLLLMVPWPDRVENLISTPLQVLALRGAVAALELCGLTVSHEGSMLILNDATSVAMAGASSGLYMLMAFIVVAAALAYVVHRPAWQKATLVVSSIPVAIFCNLVCIVVTALLCLSFGSKFAEGHLRDLAAWAMMPLAVLILVGELGVMAHLVIEESDGSTEARV